MKNILTLALLLLLSSQALAQIRVTGRVTDPADGSGIIGATVKEKGSTNGAVTDLDGNFALTVASLNAILT
ncbi:MAG TPA: carboxypeptidase-like regulatory domain-containing protein, partial [Saprospiraceae bacterium]|nr:carboxypeptidase-like regulatory domain-containing protein [Saprospiraceae bacterium]